MHSPWMGPVYWFGSDVVLPDLGYGLQMSHQYPDVMLPLFPRRRHALGLIVYAGRHFRTKSARRWILRIAYTARRASARIVNAYFADIEQDTLVPTSVAID